MSSETKDRVLTAARDYHREHRTGEFVPGVTPILSSGAVLDEHDRVALVEAALELRISAQADSRRFESEFAGFFGVRKAHMTNSGSSANLLALTALTSPMLEGRQLRPGDEVITTALGFPTTINPIVQNGLTPIFVDVELGTYNTTADRVRAAITPQTRAVMLAHTLGNPFPAAEIAGVAEENDLFLIEDNCDAVGSTHRGRLTGTFGDLATVSFYPAHHITSGEGGCVLTANLRLARIVESLRDWGRDCWCRPGEDDTCHKRFAYQLGDLPRGYDHKYTFSHIGYNLKSTDLQGALALSQFRKLAEFGRVRRRNWQRLHDGLREVPGLLLPRPTSDSDPSWFGFPITVLPETGIERNTLITFLESRRISTRLLFGGNITRHPAYQDVKYRISEDLTNSDIATHHTFWIGVYPGISDRMTDYMVESIARFMAEHG